ncbi:hypothetical protein BJ166DRAFT_504616 [Pestalotiopsis sp. NC0098]|nr:hypothetical protein BJ166DRAFT_504616 [Pestalotiopsis sp. NC0098]
MDGETTADDSASGNSQAEFSGKKTALSVRHQHVARLDLFGRVPAAQTAASTQSAAQTAVATQPLNDARRPQRLFGKVNAAMNLVKKRLSDKKYTKIGDFLSDAKMAEFLAAVRILIHDYRPDVRYAILRAVEENWHLFETNDQTGALDLDGAPWEGDKTVPFELIFAPFYEE